MGFNSAFKGLILEYEWNLATLYVCVYVCVLYLIFFFFFFTEVCVRLHHMWLCTCTSLCICSSPKRVVWFILAKQFLAHSGKWPTWRTLSSIICLFESSTCFEQLCTHLQEDNCINTASGISCINTFVLLKMSTEFLETCRGFKQIHYRRKCASSWSLTRITRKCTVKKIY
jgi:hypothetical protein